MPFSVQSASCMRPERLVPWTRERVVGPNRPRTRRRPRSRIDAMSSGFALIVG
jgi:hypothetical protein